MYQPPTELRKLQPSDYHIHQMRHLSNCCISCQVFLNLEVQFFGTSRWGPSWIPWGAMNTLVNSWLNFSKKKSPGTDRSWRFERAWLKLPVLVHMVPSRSSQLQQAAEDLLGMRMGQWAETEVIFIIYIIWFTLNILKLQVVLWQDVREQQQTHLKDVWRITR